MLLGGAHADNQVMGSPGGRQVADISSFSVSEEVASDEGTRRVRVMVVTSPACHFCADAQAVLADLARTHPLDVRTVDMATDEGRAIVREHGAPMPPVVLVEGKLLGWGRLSRGKLRRRLDERLER